MPGREGLPDSIIANPKNMTERQSGILRYWRDLISTHAAGGPIRVAAWPIIEIIIDLACDRLRADMPIPCGLIRPPANDAGGLQGILEHSDPHNFNALLIPESP